MVFIITVLLGCIIIFLIDFMLKSKLKVPIPKRIPLLGNALALGRYPHITLANWSKKHGNLLMLQALRENFLIVNGYNAVYETLHTQGKATAGRYCGFRMQLLFNFENPNGLICQSMSPKWKKLRTFTHGKLKQYGEGLTRIEGIALSVTKDLICAFERDMVDGKLDLYENIYLAVVSSLSSIIGGKKYSPDDQLFKKWLIVEKFVVKYLTLGEGLELDMFPWLSYFKPHSYKMIQVLKKETSELYAMLKRDFQQNPTKDSEGLAVSLFQLLEKQQHNNNNNNNNNGNDFLSEDAVKFTLNDIIVAGTATTSGALYAFLLIMAQHSDIQEKVVAEILANCNDEGDITLPARENMPFTRACLLELQRYGSFVPLSAVHKALSDTTIQGTSIPKDTLIMTNFWSVLHDAEIWENPFEFNPYRFLDDDGNVISSDDVKRKKMMSFGMGPRMCLGQSLANARIFIFVTNILKRFKIEKIENEDLHYDCRTYDFGLALKPKRCRVKLSIRA